MKSKYNILGDVSVIESVNETKALARKQGKKDPTKYYENHLQRLEGDYLRYCYYDVKLTGKKVYGQRGLISPENLTVELHLKALKAGLLNPKLWKPFANAVLESLEEE